VVFSLLGYFVCMIMALTAAVGAIIGLSNFSTSEGVRHYPRPVAERNVTATDTEPRLFMSVPDAKGAAPAKNIETNSTVVPTEKADAKKNEPHKPKMFARQRNKYEARGYWNAQGYAQETQYGQQRPFSNW
jgi:hypothetical protein